MSYTSLSTFKQRLRAGHPPIETKEEWQAIYRAVQKHHKNKQHYALSSETGLIEIDTSVLLLSEEDTSDQADIKVFNEFIGNLRNISVLLRHKVSVTLEAAQIMHCMKYVRHMALKKLEHNRQGYKCSFTGELDPSNLLIEIHYYTEDKWYKPVYSVAERYALWLQALYMIQTFTTELLQHIEQLSDTFFEKMNAAIQVAWEFVFPLSTTTTTTTSVSS